MCSIVDKEKHGAYNMKLSILIISRSYERLKLLFESIAASSITEEMEILVSWNGHDKLPIFREIEAALNVRIFSISPYNFANNNNRLAKLARGQFVLFLNDDMILDKRCLEEALSEIERPEVGIVGARLRYQSGMVQHAGVFFDSNLIPYHRFKNAVLHTSQVVARDEFVPAVTGAFLLIRRDEFRAIEFDPRFQVAGEDVVLCLSYRLKFQKGVLYCANASAIHYENATRKETDERSTPPADMALIQEVASQAINSVPLHRVLRPKVRIVTEKEGWIMHRKGAEIQKHFGEEYVQINQDWPDADIHYYINYGYFNKKPARGITIANFTHFDPESLADKFVEVAFKVDFCTSVSEATTDKLLSIGIPRDKIRTIRVGADASFAPKLTLGVSGRPYKGGRKGEDLLERMISDRDIQASCRIVARNPEWGLPIIGVDDAADFYRAIDFLLITSRIEGGPVPFMEALACGTLSIAPGIGVVPEFPHIRYDVGSFESLKSVVLETSTNFLQTRMQLASTICDQDWSGWSVKHEKLFRRLMIGRPLS